MSIPALAIAVLAAQQRRLFRKRPVFQRHAAVSPKGLLNLQQTIGAEFCRQLLEWLLHVGYGDLGEDLSFREGWFARVSTVALAGAVIFAQDVLGSFYAFDEAGRIYHFLRFEPCFSLTYNVHISFSNSSKWWISGRLLFKSPCG